MIEAGLPGFESQGWFALLAPKGTPAAILDRLNTEVNEILQDPEVRKSLADMGAAPLGGSRQALAEHLAAETSKWARVVKEDASAVHSPPLCKKRPGDAWPARATGPGRRFP